MTLLFRQLEQYGYSICQAYISICQNFFGCTGKKKKEKNIVTLPTNSNHIVKESMEKSYSCSFMLHKRREGRRKEELYL